MIFIQGTDFEIEGRTAITLGKFDGMHKGHQELLRQLETFRKTGLKTVVFTFGTSPYELLRGTKQVLMTNAEKEAFCAAEEADYLIEYPFTQEVCRMTAEDFVKRVLVDQLHVKEIVVGTDFCFGYQRRGNVAFLKECAARFDFTVHDVVKLTDETGREISSTYIREMLQEGRMEKVADLSGMAYQVTGEIVHGKQLGRTYGIPTINVIPDPAKFLPPNGVYVSTVRVDGREFQSVTNIGVRPTVSSEGKINMETFLFDFSGDIYGHQATVQLLHFVRPERRFDSLSELETQIRRDTDTALSWFKDGPGAQRQN